MGVITIIITSFIASLLTLFSGFGLGTILTPVVAIFFPAAVAVALTAVVHLLNNLFKLALLWRHVNWPIVLQFGVPALIAAIPGAMALTIVSTLPDIQHYHIFQIPATITPVKLVIGLLLIIFATLEWLPVLKNIQFNNKTIAVAGLLSGFFGGLSGNQGAFRSAFLVKASLDKNQFVACNAAIASMVDVSRLIIYGIHFSLLMAHVDISILALASFSAFAGALTGTLFLKKMTIDSIQKIVVSGLYILGLLLISGLI